MPLLLSETLSAPLSFASSASALFRNLLTTLPVLTRRLPPVSFLTPLRPTGPRLSSTVPLAVPPSPRAPLAAPLELPLDLFSPNRASFSTAPSSPDASTAFPTLRQKSRPSRLVAPASTLDFADCV